MESARQTRSASRNTVVTIASGPRYQQSTKVRGDRCTETKRVKHSGKDTLELQPLPTRAYEHAAIHCEPPKLTNCADTSIARSQNQFQSNRSREFVLGAIVAGINLTYSHSIVAGGLPEMSYTTREIPATSLTIRRETSCR